MNVNPIELSADGRHLYFQPSAGPVMMRTETCLLRNFSIPDAVLSGAIESMGHGSFNAGMTMTADGSIYFSDIEPGGITRRYPDERFEVIAHDPASILV